MLEVKGQMLHCSEKWTALERNDRDGGGEKNKQKKTPGDDLMGKWEINVLNKALGFIETD